MPKKKHVKKNRPQPWADANQGKKERSARIKKQNEYIIKKLAELRAKQELERKQREAMMGGTGSSTIIDGMKDPSDSSATI